MKRTVFVGVIVALLALFAAGAAAWAETPCCGSHPLSVWAEGSSLKVYLPYGGYVYVFEGDTLLFPNRGNIANHFVYPGYYTISLRGILPPGIHRITVGASTTEIAMLYFPLGKQYLNVEEIRWLPVSPCQIWTGQITFRMPPPPVCISPPAPVITVNVSPCPPPPCCLPAWLFLLLLVGSCGG